MSTKLEQALARVLLAGKVGRPAALRLLAYQRDFDGVHRAQAIAALERAEHWLDDRVEAVWAAGEQEGETSLLARLARGGSALISCGSAGSSPGVLEATLFGSRGIAAWHAAPAEAVRFVPGPRHAALEQLAAQGWFGEAVGVAPRRLSSSSSATPSPTPPPYGVLLISGDHTHQPGYAEAFASDPRCKLVAVADEADVPPRRAALNQQLAHRLGIPYLDDLPAALARSDVHIVSVCCEPRRRGRLIPMAAAAGKHLYLDKPLCGNPDELPELIRAVRQARVVAHMFSQVLWEPTRRAAELLAGGQLGALRGWHSDLCFAKGHAGSATPDGPRREDPSPRVFELPDAKRELTNIGIYQLVALLHLTGQSVRRVAAVTGNYFFKEHQQRDMEDFGQMLLTLTDGTVASMTCGRTGWWSHPAGGINRYCLHGRRQTAVLDAYTPRMELWNSQPPWTAPERDPEDPMGMWAAPPGHAFQPRPKEAWWTPEVPAWSTDVIHFLDSVQTGRAPAVDIELAAEATQVLFAGYRAAAQQQPVTVGDR